jgi:hypothetical protein
MPEAAPGHIEGRHPALAKRGPARFAYRGLLLWRWRSRALRHPEYAARFLFANREIWNLTYELENLDELAALLARALGVTTDRVREYLAELDSDRELVDRLARKLAERPVRNPEVRLGKRRLLYAIVRIERPGVVVETGTADGLGSAILQRALERNRDGGAAGELLTFDVDAAGGWLIDPAAADLVSHHIGDSKTLLEDALRGKQVGLFIHDSLKTEEQERTEFETAVRHAAPRLLLYTDEVRATGTLPRICRERNCDCFIFREQPRHIWAGNELGLGVCSEVPGGGARH